MRSTIENGRNRYQRKIRRRPFGPPAAERLQLKLTLTKRTVEALRPEDKPWIAWDDRLTGFGCRVQPSGTKTFIVNYRAGDGGRKAPNKRVVVGRYGRVTPEKARRLAQELLGRVAGGGDPAGERASARGMPTLGDACKDYIEAGKNRKEMTQKSYRRYMTLYLGDWLARPLDAISWRDAEARFHLVTERRGGPTANRCLSFLCSVYRRPCVDHEGLRNPVELWLAGGGRYHPKTRRRISSPDEVLPRWRAGIEAVAVNPVHRDLLLFGLYTGMRKGEVEALRWDRVDLEAGLFRVEETKTGTPLELPVTRQIGEILARRRAGNEAMPAELRAWVFPSPSSAPGHVVSIEHLYEHITEIGGVKFWFHGLRNAFITVAERELLLPRSLTKRLVNHARPSDVTEGYAADWTVAQLRKPAQRIADKINELSLPLPMDTAVSPEREAAGRGRYPPAWPAAGFKSGL